MVRLWRKMAPSVLFFRVKHIRTSPSLRPSGPKTEVTASVTTPGASLGKQLKRAEEKAVPRHITGGSSDHTGAVHAAGFRKHTTPAG